MTVDELGPPSLKKTVLESSSFTSLHQDVLIGEFRHLIMIVNITCGHKSKVNPDN